MKFFVNSRYNINLIQAYTPNTEQEDEHLKIVDEDIEAAIKYKFLMHSNQRRIFQKPNRKFL